MVRFGFDAELGRTGVNTLPDQLISVLLLAVGTGEGRSVSSLSALIPTREPPPCRMPRVRRSGGVWARVGIRVERNKRSVKRYFVGKIAEIS